MGVRSLRLRAPCLGWGGGGVGGLEVNLPGGVVSERVKLTDLLLVWQAELTSLIIINVVFFIILTSN